MINKYFIVGCFFWAMVLVTIFCLRPKAALHEYTMENLDKKKLLLIIGVLVMTVAGCIYPMEKAVLWNGITPAHERQYEYLTEHILEGHLYLDNDNVSYKLLQMENPYDPDMRAMLGVEYEWDHAFYNGHYYMYFGVVPVFLLFLPYRLIMGESLAAYEATQIFTALFIIGMFALFQQLAKRFFPKMSLGMYLTMSVAFSVMSIWCSICVPVMYCTAMVSALCMEIWSFYFFIRAVWMEEKQEKTIVYAFFGSLFGALAFGCRPSVALANILVLPMLIVYLKNREINKRLIMQLFIAAIPYFVIGILLMLYNYVRFDNPFEFGQTYQLTIADLTQLGEQISLIGIINGIRNSFFACEPMQKTFPYFTHSSVFVNYPILLLSFVFILSKRVRESIREKQLLLVVIGLFALPVIITGIDVMWTEEVVERYRMDVYWLFGILCFMLAGVYCMSVAEEAKKRFSCFISYFSLYTTASSILYFIAYSKNNFSVNCPELLQKIQTILTLGMG